MILLDFYCLDCDFVFEELVKRDEKHKVICTSCGGKTRQKISAKNIFLNDPSSFRFRETLMRRSRDHSIREAKKNVDEFAKKWDATPKSQARWNIRKRKK